MRADKEAWSSPYPGSVRRPNLGLASANGMKMWNLAPRTSSSRLGVAKGALKNGSTSRDVASREYIAARGRGSVCYRRNPVGGSRTELVLFDWHGGAQ